MRGHGDDHQPPPGGEAGSGEGERTNSSLANAAPRFRARSAARQVKRTCGQPHPPDAEEHASASHSRIRCHSGRVLVTQGAGSTRASRVAVLTVTWRAWTASPLGLGFSHRLKWRVTGTNARDGEALSLVTSHCGFIRWRPLPLQGTDWFWEGSRRGSLCILTGGAPWTPPISAEDFVHKEDVG